MIKNKILITGYKGYIGSHLYSRLIKTNNFDVCGIDLKDGQDIINCLPNENFDYVFHMAALPRVGYSINNPSYTFKHNAYATSVLLEWAKNHNVKRVIFSSSSAVIGDGGQPNSPYGLHKKISEEECRLYSRVYGLDTVCLRYFNVFSKDQEYGGSYSTVICSWLEMINKKQPLKIEGDGNQSRDFIHIEDVIDANIFCMNYFDNFNGDFFDVGTGKDISLNEIKKIVLLNNEVQFLTMPERIGDVKSTRAQTEKLKILGWSAKINSKKAIEECFKGL